MKINKNLKRKIIVAAIFVNVFGNSINAQVSQRDGRVIRDFDGEELGMPTAPQFRRYNKSTSNSGGKLTDTWNTLLGESVYVTLDKRNDQVEIIITRKSGFTITDLTKSISELPEWSDFEEFVDETKDELMYNSYGLSYSRTSSKPTERTRCLDCKDFNHEGLGSGRTESFRSSPGSSSVDRSPASNGGTVSSEIWNDKDGTMNRFVQDKTGRVTTERTFPDGSKERNGVQIRSGESERGGNGGNGGSGSGNGGSGTSGESRGPSSERPNHEVGSGGRGK